MKIINWHANGFFLLMLKNYFKTALRGLRNNTTHSFINITGLALSLAVSILLLLWVNDELSYDRFNVNAQQAALGNPVTALKNE
jgi:hypothetical protein